MTDVMVEPETKKDNSKVEQMLVTLGRNVEELRDSDRWKAMLKVAGRFHKYSASNQIMIWMQRPDATRVAGYRQWEGMKRQVRKGEKSIKIFAPMTKKDEAGDTKVFGFKLVSVFDISQTDGEPLEGEIPWPEANGCPPGTWKAILDRVSQQFTVDIFGAGTEWDIHPGARGWYTPSTGVISIRFTDNEAGMAATLLHEAGHALDPKLNVDTDRGSKELVAESVAYILGQRMGVELYEEVEHYIASWKGSVDGLLAVVDRVKVAVEAYDNPKVPA